MSYTTEIMTEEKLIQLFSLEEDHFTDFKAKDITGKKFSKIISAFANASGGDIYLGIREENVTKIKHWEGFTCIEDVNPYIQVIESLPTVESYYDLEFLQHPTLNTYVLKMCVFKTQSIVKATDDKVFVRKGAQSLPVDTPEKMRRLELDKGITSFENEPVGESEITDATESDVYERFSRAIIPEVEPVKWLRKQRLINGDKLTVAGELLFSDEPQICLPKRSSIKIFRYRTSGAADRDMLAGQPVTIEGCAYDAIYLAVATTKEIIESIRKLGTGFENIGYPEETLHEIITNAVLHRDYSIPTDIQIRIFDNRVEVESPGKLPGHVTVENILNAQAARNPKIVRLINKFPDAPNKDVGEGLNTAFDAMNKLRLKYPEIVECENSVLVIIRHERLASPEDMVREYLETHDEITNSQGRELTGIKSENSMKRVFWKLRDQGIIEMIPGRALCKSAWRKK
ncbi:MAG: putative DNA binding domain-containing protein [Kiritimatiellae bacterium]|nr:putative DNA binding domain-containing protein [Kiritimatiellia bacterium]